MNPEKVTDTFKSMQQRVREEREAAEKRAQEAEDKRQKELVAAQARENRINEQLARIEALKENYRTIAQDISAFIGAAAEERHPTDIPATEQELGNFGGVYPQAATRPIILERVAHSEWGPGELVARLYSYPAQVVPEGGPVQSPASWFFVRVDFEPADDDVDRESVVFEKFSFPGVLETSRLQTTDPTSWVEEVQRIDFAGEDLIHLRIRADDTLKMLREMLP